MVQYNFFRGLGTLGLAVAGAAGGWIAYSRYGIDHNVPLPPAVDAERKTVEMAAGTVSYYADTRGTGRPLLLIHSINAAPSVYEMKPLFEHFAGQRPVYALDLPGYGFSERRDQRYTPELFADTITTFIEREIGETVDAIALSLSCEFVARAAFDKSTLFNTLALLAPTGLGRVIPANDTLYNVLSNPVWDKAVYDLLVTKASIRLFLNQVFSGGVPDEYIDYAYATSHQPGARYAPYYFVSGQLFTPNVRALFYNQLTMPVLVIYGDDPNVSFEHLPEVLNANDMWRAQRFTHTRSLPHWDQLGETVDALERLWTTETQAE